METLKQNYQYLPARQGQLFRVSLLRSIDDGPYLKKDIMLNNKKSLALITGKGIMQDITHYNNSMTMLQTKTKQISTIFPQNVQNISQTYLHCQSELKIISQQSKKLQKQQKILKQQLEIIFETQKKNQQQLYNQCMPLLKGLFKVIRDSRNYQKDQYHLMERTINEIQMSKKCIIEGLFECEKKIMKLEEAIGYRTHDLDQDKLEQQDIRL